MRLLGSYQVHFYAELSPPPEAQCLFATHAPLSKYGHRCTLLPRRRTPKWMFSWEQVVFSQWCAQHDTRLNSSEDKISTSFANKLQSIVSLFASCQVRSRLRSVRRSRVPSNPQSLSLHVARTLPRRDHRCSFNGYHSQRSFAGNKVH